MGKHNYPPLPPLPPEKPKEPMSTSDFIWILVVIGLIVFAGFALKAADDAHKNTERQYQEYVDSLRNN